MKPAKFEELLQKFYNGTATAEEIVLLKNEPAFLREDETYAEGLETERNVSMDWQFEDMMQTVSDKKIAFMKPRRHLMRSVAVAATLITLAFLAIMFWPAEDANVGLADIPAPIKTESKTIESIVARPEQVQEKTSVNDDKIETALAKTEKVMVKKVPAEKKPIPANDKLLEEKTKMEEYLVMVNGKPITDEADALAITRASLTMFSQNLSTTVDELKPLSEIRIKF